MSATLLDAFAVVAVFLGEPAADEVVGLLQGERCAIHPVNLAEVVDRMTRLGDIDPDDVEADVMLLGVVVADCRPSDIIDAGRLRARHYHRQERALSLGDCIAVAHALRNEMVLATADPALAATMTEEGGQVLGLPDARGRRPLA